MRISRILLYGCKGIGVDAVSAFLEKEFAVPCSEAFLTGSAELERRIRGCAIGDIYRPHGAGSRASPIAIDGHMMYDGYQLYDVVGTAVLQQAGAFHVIFTNMLTVTYSHSDMRYHARALISANPCIVSVPGMVLAPARSREYYVDAMSGLIPDTEMQKKYEGRFLTPGDSRIQQVACGYCMQAVFHFETGEPFCDTRDCRLYNAHWQSDLLHSQIANGMLCGRHAARLNAMMRARPGRQGRA